jgi:hypothetical protein
MIHMLNTLLVINSNESFVMHVFHTTTIYKCMTRFEVTGSILNHKRTQRRCAKEKLNEIGATLKPSPRK